MGAPQRKDRTVRPLKLQALPQNNTGHAMDAEHINQIGTQLASLSVRTEDLRRYL